MAVVLMGARVYRVGCVTDAVYFDLDRGWWCLMELVMVEMASV